jgi:hypothetical protein
VTADLFGIERPGSVLAHPLNPIVQKWNMLYCSSERNGRNKPAAPGFVRWRDYCVMNPTGGCSGPAHLHNLMKEMLSVQRWSVQ